MSSLQQYIEQNSAQINESLAAIASLQKQLAELNQQVRIQQQLNQAQKTASKEVDAWLAQGKKLLKDLCSVYPAEAISDLVSDVQAMASEVQEQYDNYAQSTRFLSGAEDDEEQQSQPQASELPLIVEALPAEDNDVLPLSASQVERIIEDWDEPTLEFVKQQLGINRVKRKNAIAVKIAEISVTHKALRNLLDAAQLTASLRQPVLNGKNSS